MPESRWWVRFASDQLNRPSNPMAFVKDLPNWEKGWLADEVIAPGTPFLLSPVFEYDVDLNAYLTEELATSAPKTRDASARGLAAFLTFLWRSRGGRSWRDATEVDHRAYLIWRRRDPRGPKVSGTTWDREVATVNKFYWWALKAGYLAAHPIPKRMRCRQPAGGDQNAARARDELRPATYSHDGGSERVVWLPPADYRRWRDIGIRVSEPTVYRLRRSEEGGRHAIPPIATSWSAPADRPLIGMCDSARCPQATHHNVHRPVWAEHAGRTMTFLGQLCPTRKTEKTCLQSEYDRALRVVAEIDAATAAQE